ncbi:MAG: hypothetical protein J5593_02435 [Bacteroidaceae bacterium]|nr:hypothetical protein [Bacteroidaceae bacterium]
MAKPQSKISQNSKLSLLWSCGKSVLVPTIAVFVFVALALTHFPNSERMMEYLNFFVWTPEHLSLRLSMYPGLNSMLTAWLLQFFKSAAVGFILEAGLLALMTWLAAMVPKAWGRRSWTMFAVIPAVGLVLLFLHKPSVTLEGIFMFGSLVAVGYAYRQGKAWLTTVAIAVVGLLSFWFIAFPITVLLMVALTLLQLTAKKDGNNKIMSIVNLLLPLLFIAITALSIKLSSDHLGFIPFDKRWWYVPEVWDHVTELLLLLAAPIALMFVPLVGKPSVQALITLVASVIAGLYCYNQITGNEGYHVSEKVYRLAALAEKGEWEQLLSDVREEESISNSIYLQYALLAEARLGTLPDNLFLYPINSPEMLCPRLETAPAASDFTRIFYRELGFPDEAFHQSFQYGMMASPACGFCAGSLRHMAEYSVALGDKPLAEKYLWLLERTSNNGDFVAEQRQLLAKALPLHGGAGRGSVPLRGDFFVMATAFNTEMVQHVENDPNNKAALDYLLCGLLLTKRLEVFRIVLNEYADKYKDAPLPKAYAEAAAVLRLVNPSGLSPELHYDSAIDNQLKEFNQAHAAQNDASFRGTFWYYYFYAQIPPQQEWISQSQSS